MIQEGFLVMVMLCVPVTVVGKEKERDFILVSHGEEKRLVATCLECPFGHYRTDDSLFELCLSDASANITTSSYYCARSQRFIWQYATVFMRHCWVTVPQWCFFRGETFTVLPLPPSVNEKILEELVNRISCLNIFSTMRMIHKRMNLVVEGEITSTLKELLVEVLV